MSAIGLIAQREVRQQVGSKAFRIGTAAVVVVIVAAIVVPTLLSDDDKPERLGVVDGATPARERAIAAAGRVVDVDLQVVEVADLAAAERRLRSGDLDLVVVPGPGLLVEEALDGSSRLSRVAAALSQLLRLQDDLVQAGLSADAATRALEAPPLPLRSLVPPDPDEEDGAGVAFAGALVLYGLLATYGSWIVTAVVQEKSSRVVEVLLAAVRPVDLLVGKVLGIGLVGLGHGLLFAGAALGASIAVGLDQLPDGTALAIVSALLWLMLGFAFYSFAFATAGSLASRQEDAQSASMPLVFVLLVSYFAGGAAGAQPDALPIRLLSYLPPTAPIVMPARAAGGDVAPWEIGLAVALLLLATYALARLAAHIYPRVALHSGARLKLRAAFRSQPG